MWVQTTAHGALGASDRAAPCGLPFPSTLSGLLNPPTEANFAAGDQARSRHPSRSPASPRRLPTALAATSAALDCDRAHGRAFARDCASRVHQSPQPPRGGSRAAGAFIRAPRRPPCSDASTSLPHSVAQRRGTGLRSGRDEGAAGQARSPLAHSHVSLAKCRSARWMISTEISTRTPVGERLCAASASSRSTPPLLLAADDCHLVDGSGGVIAAAMAASDEVQHSHSARS